MWYQFFDLTKDYLKLRNQNSDFITRKRMRHELDESNIVEEQNSVFNEMWVSIGLNQIRFHKFEKRKKKLTQFSTSKH